MHKHCLCCSAMVDWLSRSCIVSKRVKDPAIVAMECEYDAVPKHSNGTIFNDLERPLTQILRSRHDSTLNMSVAVRDKHTFRPTMDNLSDLTLHTHPTYRCYELKRP